MPLLHIENLSITRKNANQNLSIIDRLSLKMNEGEILGLVGESGSGKSMLALAIIGLLSPKMSMRADYLSLDGQDLMKMSEQKRQAYVSSKVSIIFQEPQSSLNPCFSIGRQLRETIKLRPFSNKKNLTEHALELLESVGIYEPEKILSLYPHQLSGGMNQRISIAIALACKPKLLIADEPTTALDVTIQSQILDLLVKLNKTEQLGLMLITHDFSILSENTDRIGVIYSGQIMEHASTKNLLSSPHHPYTKALIDSIPRLGERHQKGKRLFALPGNSPAIDQLPVGCRLGPRCPQAERNCVLPQELVVVKNHGKVRCQLTKKDKSK